MRTTNVPEIQVGDQAKQTPELLAYLLSLANDFRRELDGASLEAIPPSEPSEPSRCIIANALNFGCSIVPSSGFNDSNGSAFFHEREHAARFVKLTGQSEDEIDDLGFEYQVPLTPELNAIALAFDAGELPELEKQLA